jgi:hypothetical protein
MRFDDRPRPRRMRLLKLGLVKEGLHRRGYFLAQNSRKTIFCPS